MPGSRARSARRRSAPIAALLLAGLLPATSPAAPVDDDPWHGLFPDRVDGKVAMPRDDRLEIRFDLPEGRHRVLLVVDFGDLLERPFPAVAVEGDAGDEVEGGPGRSIVWDAAEDGFFLSGLETAWVEYMPLHTPGPEDFAGELLFVGVPAGDFLIGSPPDESGRESHEGPQAARSVDAFEITATEIPQDVWERIMGDNPSKMKDERRPVERVTFGRAVEFCGRLDAMDPDHVHRLPTEAEWEYACRAGTTSPYYWRRTSDYESTVPPSGDVGLTRWGWYTRNCGGKTREVGTKEPNLWGLHDMHGNVWEWCLDPWGAGHPDVAPDADSLWTDVLAGPDPAQRVVRGGSWRDPAARCRSASRRAVSPEEESRSIGFRVVRFPVGRSGRADASP